MSISDTLRRGFYDLVGGATCSVCDTSYSDKSKLVRCAKCGKNFCRAKIAWVEISKGSGGTQAIHWNRVGIPCGVIQKEYNFKTNQLNEAWYCAICARIDRSHSISESHVKVDIDQLYLSLSRKQ